MPQGLVRAGDDTDLRPEDLPSSPILSLACELQKVTRLFETDMVSIGLLLTFNEVIDHNTVY